ncbi:MAG: exopolysaccharide biosynthesis polyprenyl glycosylphosphotransferase [bacterium]
MAYEEVKTIVRHEDKVFTHAKTIENKKLMREGFLLSRNFNLQYRKPMQWSIKKFIDYAGTGFGILLISPILILIAILIKLDSQGPVFFKQKRVGLYGQDFYMYKFRSMKINAEADLEKLKGQNQTNDKMFKLKEDPRVTRIGRLLRKHSLDELPQLFNVLKGEMSLVGPRPPLPSEVELYDKWCYLRFATVPGLTGMWQVSGRSDITNFNKVVELDYKYIEEWSILLDFKILLKTIPVVFFGKGAS